MTLSSKTCLHCMTWLTLASLLACNQPSAIVIEPLRVINWSPSSGAFCVDVGTSVSATFSANLVASSVNTDSFTLRSSDGVVAGIVTYDSATFTARLQPNNPLLFNRLYTVVASTDIRSDDRGALAVALDASFQTVARNGCTPGVECLLPSDCPGEEICSNIGTCIAECVTDKDCYRATCESGVCTPLPEPDGGGDDGAPTDGAPADGGDAAGDPLAGDPVPGDVAGDPVPGDVAGDPAPGDPAGD